MNAQVFLLVYLLPCAIALMVLWLCYRLLLANSKSFQFNRFFLLTAMLFALALPLLGTLFGHTSALAGRTQPQWFSNTFLLNEITITPDGISPEGQAVASDIAHPANFTFNLWKLLGIIYLAGVIVSLIAFSVKILKITILTLRSPKEKKMVIPQSIPIATATPFLSCITPISQTRTYRRISSGTSCTTSHTIIPPIFFLQN